MVPPQLVPGYPDQRSTSSNPGLVWPYDENNDHNAGFSTRATTIIRVDPLPTGTTDIDLLDASWDYIDQNKIVIYGAINPAENIKVKLEQLEQTIDSIPRINFKKPVQKMLLKGEINFVELSVKFQNYDWAYRILQDGVLTRMNGCTASGNPDGDDWFKDCNTENKLYWAVNEIMILLGILL